MSNSMEHWNNNQVVVATVRFSGSQIGWHELVQVCFLPLDSNFLPRRDVLPLQLTMEIDYPERFDLKSSNMRKKDFEHSQTLIRFDEFKARDLFATWFQKLDLKHTKHGTQKKIMLLGHNSYVMNSWLNAWFREDYELYFDDTRPRDTAIAALFLNDYAGMHIENVRYPKTDLSYLRSMCKIESIRVKDCINEAVVIAGIYKVLVQRGVFR